MKTNNLNPQSLPGRVGRVQILTTTTL